MQTYEKMIEIAKEIGKQNFMRSTFTLEQFLELIDTICNDYGKTKDEVIADLER